MAPKLLQSRSHYATQPRGSAAGHVGFSLAGGGGGQENPPKSWGGGCFAELACLPAVVARTPQGSARGVRESGSIDRYHLSVIMNSGAEGADEIFFLALKLVNFFHQIFGK